MFMPVIFACLLNGQCEFYTDNVTNLKSCEESVKQHIQMAQQSGKFSMAYGSCLQVTFAKTTPITGGNRESGEIRLLYTPANQTK